MSCACVIGIVRKDKIMDDSDRVELINRKEYWGILSFQDVESILQNIRRLNLCPSTGWFLWETKCISKDGKHNVAVALTQLRCITSHGYYITKMDRGLEVSKYHSANPDAYTVYIVKSPVDGRYYEYNQLALVYTGYLIVNSSTFTTRYSSSTLDKAIKRILLRYSMFEHFTYWPGPSHICKPLSRFTSVCDSKHPHVPKLWSLQNLCLFFIRNYLLIYDHYSEFRLPQLLVDMISRMNAVKLCAEK
jgi:hypothetical protein